MDARLQQYNGSTVAQHHENTPKKEEAKEFINENKVKVIENKSGYTNNPSPTKSTYSSVYYTKPQQNSNNYQSYTGYSNNYSYGYSKTTQKVTNAVDLEYQTRIDRVKKKAKEEAKKVKSSNSNVEYTKSIYGFGDFKVKSSRKSTKAKKMTKQIGVLTATIIGEAALGTLLVMTKETIKQIGEIVKDNIF